MYRKKAAAAKQAKAVVVAVAKQAKAVVVAVGCHYPARSKNRQNRKQRLSQLARPCACPRALLTRADHWTAMNTIAIIFVTPFKLSG
jgi:hypothetical protein